MCSVTSWRKTERGILLELEEGIFEVSFASPDIVRVRCTNEKNFLNEKTYVVEKPPLYERFVVMNQEKTVSLVTDKLRIKIWLNPILLEVKGSDGKDTLSSKFGSFVEFKENKKIMRFHLRELESIYGLGQDPMANLNQRDKERRMWQQWDGFRRSGNAGVPFLMSNLGYGILLNTSWPARFAIGKAEAAERGLGDAWAPAPWPWESSGENDPDAMTIILDEGDMDLFIICRDSFDKILRGYCELTGYAPMPPKWALGFMQCKNRYRSQEELLWIASQYRKRKIPCDVLIIDWLWFKKFGDLEWNKHYWPDPKSMLQELKNMGFYVMQAHHPFIEKESLKYETFKKLGYLNHIPEDKQSIFDRSDAFADTEGNWKEGMPTFDHSNPEAEKAWWQEIKRLYQEGIRGYWTDMGELQEHKPGTTSFLGARERVHNIYSLLWNEGLYKNQRADFDERVFSLPRTTYAGIQRYGTALWSGDIDSSWEVLKDQVVIGQGVSLSGQCYWTTDIGGFFPTREMSPELHARWFEWGTFCSIFRTHGTRPENEVWSFGGEVENICRKYINLRYRLMPYIYSCARRVTEEGRPIMRAMCLDFPDDAITHEQTLQYMFGPAFLVAPVVEKGARKRKVYLPRGRWYDFWSNEIFSGGRFVEVEAPLDKLPLFVREGSIIPTGQETEYVFEKPLDTLEIHFYKGDRPTNFELYEDDGLTYQYEKGKFTKLKMSLKCNNEIEARIGFPEGNYELDPKSVKLVIHGLSKPASVFLNGSEYHNWHYHPESKTLRMETELKEKGIVLSIKEMDYSITQRIEDIYSLRAAKLGKKAKTIEEAIALCKSLYGQDKEAFNVLFPIRMILDKDLENNGRLTLNFLIKNDDFNPDMKGKISVSAPTGWRFTQGSKSKEFILSGSLNLKWVLEPHAEALPVESNIQMRPEFELEGMKFKESRLIKFGSGFPTRWQVIGCFDNSDNSGLYREFPPEKAPDESSYKVGDEEFSWVNFEDFNPFGYIDLKSLKRKIKEDIEHGVAYAKCTVWSTKEKEVYFEVVADPNIRVWVNDSKVYESDKIVLGQKSSGSVKLIRGWNNVLIKASIWSEKPYSGRELGFKFRFVDKEGKPMKDILYKL